MSGSYRESMPIDGTSVDYSVMTFPPDEAVSLERIADAVTLIARDMSAIRHELAMTRVWIEHAARGR